jgi:hypothetical protein
MKSKWGTDTVHSRGRKNKKGEGRTQLIFHLNWSLHKVFQAQWQRADKAFTCTPTGSNPEPFVRSQGSRQELYTEPSPLWSSSHEFHLQVLDLPYLRLHCCSYSSLNQVFVKIKSCKSCKMIPSFIKQYPISLTFWLHPSWG